MPGRVIRADGRNASAQPVYPAEAEAVRKQVELVITDPLFCKSKRSSSLLRFIADRSVNGRSQDLKERIIGIEVFGRSPDYDPGLDAIVRVAANEVRKRLALYYKGPGREQELRIEVPNGSYVAKFRLPEQSPHTPQKPQPEPGGRKFWYPAAAIAVMTLALVAWILWRPLSPRPVIDQFWAPVLGGPGPVVLYLPSSPAPSSAPPLSPSVSADSGERFHDFILRNHGRLPAAGLNAASALSSFLQLHKKEAILRPARDAHLSDLRSAPAVLLGSFDNDWVMKLGDDLHFRFRRESELGLRWIEDSDNPQSRNWALDQAAPYSQVSEDYALISRVLDPSTGRWLFAISGLTGFGTIAASEIATDPKAMASLGARLPRDWANKNLQVVLAVKLVQDSPGASRVIATYSW
jgi:hypothetical protein